MKNHPDIFVNRHIGPDARETEEMLREVGVPSLDELIHRVIPSSIRLKSPLKNPEAYSEREVLQKLRELALLNEVCPSYLGWGYHDAILPPVIQRNILENPGWYTQYTPYQAEIAQGRLEALLNFQTMIVDLTGMQIANASLLDESTSAAEAMVMCRAFCEEEDAKKSFFVSNTCHPQTIEVVKTRARALDVKIIVGDHHEFHFDKKVFGVLLQYPATDGVIYDLEPFIRMAHAQGALAVVAADIMALTILRPPGEFDADVVVGNTQRFGMPMGFGGPHAGFFATREKFKRQMPGRLVGVSKDSQGKTSYRLALQTREQHIRREKATSNICTAEVLPAVVASMYAVYHGPKRLKKIAERIHAMASMLAMGLAKQGHRIHSWDFFDTIKARVKDGDAAKVVSQAKKERVNLRKEDKETLVIALDETVSSEDVMKLLRIIDNALFLNFSAEDLAKEIKPIPFPRAEKFLTHPVFNTHHSETEMLRYMKKLEAKDLSLTHSMISLGSCTMKLNPTAAMMPITWPEFAKLHPFAPSDQAEGYLQIFDDLQRWLAEATGFFAVSLQPNAGSQGEYAGLLVIRKYHEDCGEKHRNICLIPASAHGTNPASAAMAGLQVVVVQCNSEGSIDVKDLRAKAEEHRKNLAACMITYPSTHGVFEENIQEVCRIVHENGGQVYMDGANMNALVGLSSPAEVGADVCHLNLHKTFAIPHGGGGPGMGPICVAEHLEPFLPGHPFLKPNSDAIGTIAEAPWGSAVVLLIPWAYMRMMGAEGMTKATKMAILNANYIAKKLEAYFPVLFRGENGFVAHECIVDLRMFKACGVEVEDVAKRLMDYGFHAPTVSFPVPGTMMIEPTESESKAELDRFCEAMMEIHSEIKRIESKKMDAQNNPLKNAPHTAEMIASDDWDKTYSRERAAYPLPWVRENKFWPSVGRIDNVYGDRNLFCTCFVSENVKL